MSIKQDQAIAKITSEAMEMKNNFAIFIEEHLTGICTNDKVAEKLLAGKSLKEFCKRCEAEAREKAREQGSGFQIAGLPDQEYFDRVEAFYGITAEDLTAVAAPSPSGVIDIMSFL